MAVAIARVRPSGGEAPGWHCLGPGPHRYRIGVNYAALEVSKPRRPVPSYDKDGQTRFDGNGGDRPVYQPNSFGGPVDDYPYQEPPPRTSGDAARYDHREGNEDYVQAGNLFRLMSHGEQERLITNVVAALKEVSRFIHIRQIGHCVKADSAYGAGIAKGLGIAMSEADQAASTHVSKGTAVLVPTSRDPRVFHRWPSFRAYIGPGAGALGPLLPGRLARLGTQS